MLNSSSCSNQGDLVCGLCECVEERLVLLPVVCMPKVQANVGTDLWCFMFYSTELVTNASATDWATLGLCPLCARKYVCNNGECKMCVQSHFSPAFLSPLLPSGSTGSMDQQCSGPEAGECVCGQCRCRQDVNPEVSPSALVTSHCTAPANPLLGSVHTYLVL